MDTWLPMDSYEESGYPFAIPDLWRTTNSPAIQEKKIASPIDCWVLANYSLDLGLDLKGKNEDLPEFFEKVDFSLPNLDEPEFRPLEDLGLHPVSLSPELSDDSLDESETSSDFAQPIEGDTSLCQEVITRAGEHLKLKSWELFNNGGFEEPRSQFISERGAIAFDAAVIAHDEDTGAMCGGKCGRILQSGPLLTVSVHNRVEIRLPLRISRGFLCSDLADSRYYSVMSRQSKHFSRASNTGACQVIP